MWCGRGSTTVAVLAVLLVAALPVGVGASDEGPDWADPAAASIRPGVRVNTPSGTCTSNFIFSAGADVFIGTAAHCFTTSGSTQTNGCLAGTHPLGVNVGIQGAAHDGVLVYSSWIAMKQAGEPTNSVQCQYNDFALIRIHPDDVSRVNPAMRFFGGPVDIASSASTLHKVITYGNTPLRPGVGLGNAFHTHAREGYVLTGSGGGWSHQVYTVTPGLPGDSGSGVMTGDGRGLGILVTLQIFPYAASNGVTNLQRALGYANEATGAGYTLATWELFTDGYLP